MSKKVSFQEIMNACLRGVRRAFSNYDKWSGGEGLGYAPESYIQVEIARSLAKICPYVTLEDTVREILSYARAEMRGKPPRGNSNGRVDIITWWRNETPRALIEVKKVWSNDKIKPDAERLRQLAKRKRSGSKIEGLIVAYTSAQNPETINSRFKTLEGNSNTQIACRLGPVKKYDGSGNWYWDAGCFEICN